MSKINIGLTRQKGFSIMEVLIAIIIFAIGMIALAQLQGTLSRSSANANVRTVSSNIAEEKIEIMRQFGRLAVDPDGLIPAYADVPSCGYSNLTSCSITTNTDTGAITMTGTESRGGINYTVTATVNNWYYHIASDSFWDASTYFAQKPAPSDLFSDFKLVSIEVSWDDTRPWLIDVGSSFTADTSITISSVISSVTPGGSSKVASQLEEAEDWTPFVDYHPGENPDVVSLGLGDKKFKETLTPEPTVYRETLETRFDVITYSQTGSGALFLRREEFLAVSCECTLQTVLSEDDPQPGRRPTIWIGDEYLEPEFVAKSYGVALTKITQSTYCDTCCQDHHDGGTGENDGSLEAAALLYSPVRAGLTGEYGSDGDHVHWSKGKSKGRAEAKFSIAANGDTYLEACKLVRVDGFFRVTQDFRLEGLNTFPEDYLLTDTQVGEYSEYVTDEVLEYTDDAILLDNGYLTSNTPPAIVPPLRTDYPATVPATDHLTLAYTSLPTPTLAEEQQLRSRGIYIDYLPSDLRAVIKCIQAVTDPEEKLKCKQGHVELDQTASTNILEILPFFELQTTFLNEWSEDPVHYYVEISNDHPIQTGNLHSRGKATQLTSTGGAVGYTTAYRGNTGLTGTDPINNDAYLDATMTSEIDIVIDTDNPTHPSGTIISGTLIAFVDLLQVSSVTISATEASCNYTSPVFTCFIPTGAVKPTMTLVGYQVKSVKVVACSADDTLPNVDSDTSGNPFAKFDLTNASATPAAPYVIWFDATTCTTS